MKKDDFLKKVIIAMAIFLTIFTIVVMILFYTTGGSEPSTLIVSVFAACMGEYSICGLIKTKKKDNQQFPTEDDSTEEELIEEVDADEEIDDINE